MHEASASPTVQRPAPNPRLVLGSTSRYRAELLARLGLPFQTLAPDVDETPRPQETPRDLAVRLAWAKAQAVAARCTDDAVVIGSDQVADLAGQPLGKPGDHAGAVRQLKAMSGCAVQFHTAVTVLRLRKEATRHLVSTVTVRVRALDDATIEAYLRHDQPYDCAGSAKVEGLGIALLDAVHSDDPTALIGLPLIGLCRILRELGLDPLAARG